MLLYMAISRTWLRQDVRDVGVEWFARTRQVTLVLLRVTEVRNLDYACEREINSVLRQVYDRRRMVKSPHHLHLIVLVFEICLLHVARK